MSRLRLDHHHPPDDSQRAVIHARENAIRLVAPAGSGKTETLVRRVIERTSKDGIDPRRILMLTFDNNARQAISRLMTAFAPGQGLSRQITFVTFNSFGNDVLKQWFPDEIAQRIVSDPEVRAIRRELPPLPILSWDEQKRDPIDAFRAMKEQAICPIERDRARAHSWLRTNYLELPEVGGTLDLSGSGENLADTETAVQLDAVFDAYLRYEKMLRDRNRMDFQDQKLRPLIRLMQSMKQNPAIIAHLRDRYDEVVIDEAQDISSLDALLIWCTIGPQTTLTLAGDDDQTIYEFRQASSVFLRDAAKYFQREFTTYLLNINYRSPENILSPAQRLIAHNVERIEKGVSSARSAPGEVVVQVAGTHGERVTQVVRQIRDLHARGYDWADIGILVPTTFQQDPFKQALYRAGIRTKQNTGQNDKSSVIEQAVELSTFHRAKGRQWRAVLLPMSSDGEMPRLDEVQQGNLEAERRAFYVSMSRAADVLIIGYLRPDTHAIDTIDRSLSGEITGTSGASRFLFESGLVIEQAIPAETAIKVDEQAQPEPATESSITDAESHPAPANEAIPSSTATPPARQSVADRLRQKDPGALRNLGRTTPTAPTPAMAETTDAATVHPADAATETAPSKPTRADRAAQREERDAASAQGLTVIPMALMEKVERAEHFTKDLDYEYALFAAWQAVFGMLRLLDARPDAEKREAYEIITDLSHAGIIQQPWQSRLNTWRKIRNQGYKNDRFNNTGITQMVTDLRPFMTMVSDALSLQTGIAKPAQPAVAPTPQVEAIPSTTPSAKPTTIYPIPTLQAYQTARMLANGGYDPVKKKTIRTIGIHTLNHGVEFLPLQLAMILLDVKFFVPGEFRYSSSPVFARYCDRKSEVRLHANLRPLVHQPADVSPAVEQRIHTLLDEMLAAVVAQEGYRGKPDAILDSRLRDAIRLANGEVNRGVRIEPLASSKGASWSKG